MPIYLCCYLNAFILLIIPCMLSLTFINDAYLAFVAVLGT